MGPIGVRQHLVDFLPGKGDVGHVSSSEYSSASILTISHAYLAMLGKQYVKEATAVAILNSNYMMKRLSKYFKIAFTGKNGLVAHEFILGNPELIIKAECIQESRRDLFGCENILIF